MTFVGSSIFVGMAEKEQRIKFKEMETEEEVVKKTVACFFKNERITEEDKHRYEY